MYYNWLCTVDSVYPRKVLLCSGIIITYLRRNIESKQYWLVFELLSKQIRNKFPRE